MSDQNGTPSPQVALNPALDPVVIRKRFDATGRAQINGILDRASADRFFTCLSQELPWRLAYNEGGNAREMTAQAMRQMTPEQHSQFQSEIWDRASRQFQYAYSDYPVAQTLNDPAQPRFYVHDVLEFINSEPFLSFLREATGLDGKVYADGHATCYRAGHFLTIHDDKNANTQREIAYVFNMTPSWRPDWGGALQFYNEDLSIAESFAPAFNALNIFRVPQAHAVTFVPPYATSGRFGMTGWFHRAD